VRWIRHLQNALTNPWFRKQGTTLANFILCYQKISVLKDVSLKVMLIYTDHQGTFWLLFAFLFYQLLQFENELPQFGVS